MASLGIAPHLFLATRNPKDPKVKNGMGKRKTLQFVTRKLQFHARLTEMKGVTQVLLGYNR